MNGSLGKSILFDTSAILKIVNRYRGFENVERIISQVENKKINGLISSISLYEIITVAGITNSKRAAQTIAFLEEIGFQILQIDGETAKSAALRKLKNLHLNLSTADWIIVQMGISAEVEIVTADKEWAKLTEAKITLV